MLARTFFGTGRPGSESLTIGGQAYTISAAYGTKSPTMTLACVDSFVLVRTPNGRGRLLPGGRTASYTYDAPGRRHGCQLVTGRRQLIDFRAAEKNRLETSSVPTVRQYIAVVLELLTEQVEQVDQLILEPLESDDDGNTKSQTNHGAPSLAASYSR